MILIQLVVILITDKNIFESFELEKVSHTSAYGNSLKCQINISIRGGRWGGATAALNNMSAAANSSTLLTTEAKKSSYRKLA